MTTPKRLLSIPEAAESIGKKPDYVRKAIHAGDLKAKRVGSDAKFTYAIRPADLDAYVDSLPDA